METVVRGPLDPPPQLLFYLGYIGPIFDNLYKLIIMSTTDRPNDTIDIFAPAWKHRAR